MEGKLLSFFRQSFSSTIFSNFVFKLSIISIIDLLLFFFCYIFLSPSSSSLPQAKDRLEGELKEVRKERGDLRQMVEGLHGWVDGWNFG